MSQSKPSTEDKIKKFFETQINQSGYSLQTSIQNKLKNALFETSREVHYVDQDESKGRPIDLTSFRIIPDERILQANMRYVAGSLRLVIECKQLPDHAWVFFRSKFPPFAIPEIVSITDNKTPNPALRYMPTVDRLIDLPYAEGYAELFLPAKKIKKGKSNEREGNLYEAVMTVTKATRHEIETTRSNLQTLMRARPPRMITTRILLFTIFQPLIVFKGRMYEAIQEGEELKLYPIKFVQLPKNYASKHYNEVLGQIHIVSYDAFDEYLQKIQTYYGQNAQTMIQDQTELLKTVDAL